MKINKKIIIGIVALMLLMVVVYFTGFSFQEEPDWFPFVSQEVKDAYWEFVDDTNRLQLLSSSGTPFPDPDKSMILPVSPLEWWSGHGCTPTALGMIYLYYDENFGTNFLGNSYVQYKPNGDIIDDIGYQYLATHNHLVSCFCWNEAGDDTEAGGYCTSRGLPSPGCGDSDSICQQGRQELCLADFIKTCNGGTRTSENCIGNTFEFFTRQADFCAWRSQPTPTITRYVDPDCDIDYPWNNPRGCSHIETPVTYSLLKAELNEGRPIHIMTPGHSMVAIGWCEDYRYRNSPQIVFYTGWQQSYGYLEIDELENGDNFWIHTVDFMDFGIDTTGDDDDDDDGDMNGNGVTNVADVRYLAMHLMGVSGYETVHSPPDVNCNNVVNANDVRYLAMFLMDVPEYVPLYPTC